MKFKIEVPNLMINIKLYKDKVTDYYPKLNQADNNSKNRKQMLQMLKDKLGMPNKNHIKSKAIINHL